jgi:hypothetical protein
MFPKHQALEHVPPGWLPAAAVYLWMCDSSICLVDAACTESPLVFHLPLQYWLGHNYVKHAPLYAEYGDLEETRPKEAIVL